MLSRIGLVLRGLMALLLLLRGVGWGHDYV